MELLWLFVLDGAAPEPGKLAGVASPPGIADDMDASAGAIC